MEWLTHALVGIGAAVASVLGTLATVKRWRRAERAADAKAGIELQADAKAAKIVDEEAGEEYLRRQREKDRGENAAFISRVQAQLDEYDRRTAIANDGHVACRQELATVKGELAAALNLIERQDERISELEARLQKAGVK